MGACEAQHIWCLVPLKGTGLGKDGEIILCQAALACAWLCGLHAAPMEERVVAWGLEFVPKP